MPHRIDRLIRRIPTDPLMEVSHAIRKEGALTFGNCHGPAGVLDWEALGYTDAEAAKLAEDRQPY